MKTRTFLLALTLILPALTPLQTPAQSVYEPYTFTTLAGETVDGGHGYPGYGSTDGTGTTARFANPYGVAVDSAGNIYVADTLNQTIRHVTSAGVVTTLAGQGYGAFGSEDGTGSAARFAYPWGVAVDSAGNVYVADTVNNTIRKGIPAVGPPVILTQPQGQVVKGGDNHTFAVLVNGAAPMTYQWRKNGTDIAGATNNSYNILGVQLTDAGAYSLGASNGLGQVIIGSTRKIHPTLVPLIRQ